MRRSLVALSFGTLLLGIAEFVMMGILPYVASELKVTIAQAGHLISAYAIGVSVGAPALILARKFPLKRILLALVCMIMIGNTLASVSPNYWMMMAARFISGLPHGAYFGVASIAASKLAARGKSAEAVSIMISGMTVANLFGVPLGTALSESISWRIPFMLVGAGSLIVLFYIWRWVPDVEGVKDTGLRGQFKFLKKPAPWLLLSAIVLGNGGIFCWYSYINPLLVHVSGFSESTVTFLMVLAGFGMVIGNLTGGVLSDKFSPAKVAAFTQLFAAAVLFAIFFWAHISWMAVLLMTLCAGSLFAISAPQQLLIIRFSKGGEMLGAAGAQVSFNLGNALGAFLGGLPIAAGLGYHYSALVGAPFALMGFAMLFIFHKKFEIPYEAEH